MLSHFLQNKILSAILIGVFLTIAISIGIFTDTFNQLNNNFSNSLYTLKKPSKEIIIISIDDKSTQSPPVGLGRFNQWTRENFTKLLKALENENPKVITFDFVFNTLTETVPKNKIKEAFYNAQKTQNKEKLNLYEEFLKSYQSSLDDPTDLEFAEELNKRNNIILAAALDENGQLIGPLSKFLQNAEVGIINATPDKSGIIRKVTPFFNKYNDLAVASLKKYLQKNNFDIPTDKNKEMMVNFFGDPFSFQMISFIDVVNKKFEQNYFKDKIVLVGSTAFKEIHDEVLTPKSNKTPMSGVEFRANEIQTILEGKFLKEQSKLSQIITIAIIAIGLTIALNYLGIFASILITLAVIILYLLAAHFFYRRGLIINMVYPFITIILSYLGSLVYKYFIADRKKRELKSAFSHYVSNDLVEEISKNPDVVKLGGEKKVVTVFFSDIKNSTTYSEKTDIESWVSQINEYFTEMGKVIKKSGGTLDKYEGDAIMAFWNAPISQPDHVLRAYATALGMKKTLVQLHEKWKTENKPLIEFRIGINTGEALVGNFGSNDRFDYTVMGDTVNTASRLESSANKTYGTKIIVAGSEKIPDEFITRELDSVILPGKDQPVKIYELICLASEENYEVKKLVENYHNGLVAYRKKDFKAAIEIFSTYKEDQPSKILLNRCETLETGEKMDALDENTNFKIFNK